jgi:hypothetical protein
MRPCDFTTQAVKTDRLRSMASSYTMITSPMTLTPPQIIGTAVRHSARRGDKEDGSNGPFQGALESEAWPTSKAARPPRKA